MDITTGLTERKYVSLRQRLDELGYHQPLTFEALLLVEKLLNDLLHTTERLAYFKDLSQKTCHEFACFKNGMESYMAENAKLTQENNFLHSKLMAQVADADKSKQKIKSQMNALKSENYDLQFLNSEYITKIKILEKEISERNHRILQLQNENLQAVIVAPGSEKDVKQSRQPKMELRHPLPVNKKWTETYLSAVSQVKDSYVANMVGMADDKIQSLSEELRDYKNRNKENEELISYLRNKVLCLEKEIFLLKSKVDGAWCLKHFDCGDAPEKSGTNISPLKIAEMKELEKINTGLKVQVKDVVYKQHEAMEQAVKLAEHNRNLEKELRDIDQMAMAVEADCKSSLKNYIDRVSKIQDKFESSLVRIHDLEQEILELKHQNVDLKRKIDDKNESRKGCESYMERMLGEKKREMEALNQNVKHLTEKTEQLSRTICSQKQRILELETKLLENVESWKSVKHPVMPNGKGVRHHFDHICDPNPAKIDDSSKKSELLVSSMKRELDSAKSDVQRLEEELAAQRGELKMETKLHEETKLQLEETRSELEAQVKKLELEQRELTMGQGSMRTVVKRHEATIRKLEESLKNAQTDYQREKNLNSQLKTLQDQTEQSLMESQARVLELENEVKELMYSAKKYEDNYLKVNEDAEVQKRDLVSLRESLKQMDRDKDSLLIKIDDKTERIATLENGLKEKNSRIAHLEGTVAELRKQFDLTIDDGVMRNHEKLNLQQQMERLQQELSLVKTHKDNALRENRRIQDDLASVTNDCRIARHELEDSRREVEDLKLQLQGYVDEVRRIEDLLAHKEEERNDLLEQFRNLSAEASVLESANHSLESETTDARIQLRMTNERISDLERQVDDSHSLIRGYENQISHLTHQVATLEMQLRSQEDQKARLESDLTAARELSAKLDSQKEQLMQLIDSKDIEKKSVDREVSQLRKEKEKWQSETGVDKESMKSLESKLSLKRKECLEGEMAYQEAKMEIEELKRKLRELECKLKLSSFGEKAEDGGGDRLRREDHSPADSCFSG